MNPGYRLPAVTALLLLFSLSLYAQDRDLRAERILIDDDSGERIVLIAPHPMPPGSSYSLTLPDSLPSSDFVLMGNASGSMSALEPNVALNPISWLRSGNSGSDPFVDFIGTNDSADLVFRTYGLEQMRISALGDVTIGFPGSCSERLRVGELFTDSVPIDPLLGIPLSFGIRSEAFGPFLSMDEGVYASSGSLMYIQGIDDISNASLFAGSLALAHNTHTASAIVDMSGAVGLALQDDPSSSVSGSITGVTAEAIVVDGIANEAAGVGAAVSVEFGTVSTASGIVSGLDLLGSGTVAQGYGLLLEDPEVDMSATLGSYTGIQLENIDDSGATAIRYDGTGTNAPFIVEGDGDVGVGTTTPTEARLHVAKTFADSMGVDPTFGVPLAFGLRTEVTSPDAAFANGVYVGSAGLTSVTGAADMSTAGMFIGGVGITSNSNTGGAINGAIGLLGQVLQTDAGATTGLTIGVQARSQVSGGTVTQALGMMTGAEIEEGTVSMAAGLTAGVAAWGTSTVSNGYGLFVQDPYVDAGATLSSYVGIEIDNINDSGAIALRYNGSGSNVPFIIEGDGDVGIGTTTPGESQLRVVTIFPDSVAIDPYFNEPLIFGARVDATSPSVVDSGAVYLASGNVMFVEGASDLSDAETFVGGVSMVMNTNSGGNVKGLFGLVGQSVLDEPAATADNVLGVLGSVEIIEGTVSGGIGVIGSIDMEGGAAGMLLGMRSEISLIGTASVTDGIGLYIAEPEVGGSATLTNYTGLAIGDLSGTGYTAMHYSGSNPFVIQDDGDVGVGNDTPNARLDVENNDASSAALLVTNSHPDGTGLHVADGGVVLSHASGAPATIPVGVAVFDINDGSGSSTPSVDPPATGTNGQILYIYVSDPDGATVDGNARGAGDAMTYIYVAGAWQLFHAN